VSVESEGALQPWVIKALIWIAISITSLFTATYGWLFRDVVHRVKALEGNDKKYATALSVSQLEVRSRTELLAYLKQMRDDQERLALSVSQLEVRSRTELLAYLKQMRDDQEGLSEQVRDDQQRLHKENRDDNSALRSDVRAVHTRVDELFRK
jgi:hypothetical protein